MISEYFIGYLEKSKGYRFYVPNHSPRIVETSNARFLKNDEVSESVSKQIVDIKEIRVDFPILINVHLLTTTTNVVLEINQCLNNVEQHLNDKTPIKKLTKV